MKNIIIHSDAYPKEMLCVYTRRWRKHPTIFSYQGLFIITMSYFSSPPNEGIHCVTSARLGALEPRLFRQSAALQTFSARL